MMHMMHYKLVIAGSKIVAACHYTSIRISEICNVDKKVRLLFNYSRCELLAGTRIYCFMTTWLIYTLLTLQIKIILDITMYSKEAILIF